MPYYACWAHLKKGSTKEKRGRKYQIKKVVRKKKRRHKPLCTLISLRVPSGRWSSIIKSANSTTNAYPNGNGPNCYLQANSQKIKGFKPKPEKHYIVCVSRTSHTQQGTENEVLIPSEDFRTTNKMVQILRWTWSWAIECDSENWVE